METVLERVGSSNAGEWLHVPNNKTVVFGRAVTCDIRLYSEFISRRHAVINCNNGRVDITDLQSVNGVHVNSLKLVPNEPHVLNAGDKVEIGKPSDEEEWDHLQLCDRFVYIVKEEDRGLVHSRPTPVRVHKSAFTVKQKEERLKTCHENKHPVVESDGVTDAQRCKAVSDTISVPSEVMANSVQAKFTSIENQKLESADAKLAALERRLLVQRQEASKEKQLLEDVFRDQVGALKAELAGYKSKLLESTSSKEKDELQRKEAELSEKLREMKRKEEAERAELRRKEEMLRRKEELLKEELLKEKALARQREEEAAVLARAEAEKRAKQKVVGRIEEELQCIVCSEPFIKSTTLNCSHTFCQFCIEAWLSRQSICPVCRTEVTSRNRSLVLDNYIDTVIAEMSPELQERRKALIDERSKAVAHAPKKKKKRK